MEKSDNQTLMPNELFPCVILFGPPGAGKGTVGRILASAGNHVHLSSGDIFRTLDPESTAGKLFQQYAGKGFLVPDEVTMQIWYHYVCGLIATNRYFPKKQLLLLDGIPRNPAQVKLISKYVKVLAVLVLDMPNTDGLIQRLKKRAIIEKRMDDAEESVLTKRMQVYEKETLEILGSFPQDLKYHCNADQKPLDVLRDVLTKLSSILSYK